MMGVQGRERNNSLFIFRGKNTALDTGVAVKMAEQRESCKPAGSFL